MVSLGDILAEVVRLRWTVSKLEPLIGYVDELVNFIESPIQFLRKRLAPVILGGIFGFVFDLAEIIRRPFVLLISSLEATGGAFENAFSVTFDPIQWVFRVVLGAFRDTAAAFGPLQPFVLAALILAFSYLMIVLGVRLLRAVLDSVPGLSGVETFLFG
jgi:hypothetical protein